MLRLPPPDLFDFWATTATRLAGVPPQPEVVPAPIQATPTGVDVSTVMCTSLGGVRISGYLAAWQDDQPRPLVVHAHGYRSHVEPRLDWVAAGLHVVGIDVRGHGASIDAARSSPHGWVLTGARTPEDSVIRGAVCDYVRMRDVVVELLGPRVATQVSHGASLGGAIALMAEAMAPGADLLVLEQPTFGWPEGRRLLAELGSGAELHHFLAQRPDHIEDDLLDVLAYFDTTALAPWVTAPTLLGIGHRDRVVPAATVWPLAAALTAPCEVMELPVSHGTPKEMEPWKAFETRWLELAPGLPKDFGSPRAARAG